MYLNRSSVQASGNRRSVEISAVLYTDSTFAARGEAFHTTMVDRLRDFAGRSGDDAAVL
jgi:hypothetical protein